jgi:hypothetical protein
VGEAHVGELLLLRAAPYALGKPRQSLLQGGTPAQGRLFNRHQKQEN